MSDWADLDAELELWHQAGKTATFWWRDDDAVTDTPALQRLLAARALLNVPLALAVVPAGADTALATCVGDAVAVLQHGYAHRNHAPGSGPKVELGADRTLDAVALELSHGWEWLKALFGARPLPVMVPPWNRIAPTVKQQLPQWGYHGISTFKARGGGTALIEVNTHVDIVDWGGARGFVGDGRALDDAIEHLMLRRTGGADGAEPTGLLTHHLAHDEGCWEFVQGFVTRTQKHAAARWLDARDIFAA